MIASYTSTGSQVVMLLQELRVTQPVIFLFIEDFVTRRRTYRNCAQVLFAALMPHFKDPLRFEPRIEAIPVNDVEIEFSLFARSEDAKALKGLTRRLQDRQVYQTSGRRYIHDTLRQDFVQCKDRPLSPLDARNAELLFLAIWEMKARALASRGQTLTP